MTERRRVRLLIPDLNDTRLAVEADGHIPIVDLTFEGGSGVTTASAVDAALRSLPVRASLVEYCIDQTTDDGFDGFIEVIAHVEVSPPEVARPVTGWRWSAPDEAVVDTVPSLRPFVEAWLAEWAGAPVPVLRSAWSQRGWFGTFRTWIDEQLLARGGVAASDVVPFRMWGISAVFRVETAVGVRWAKAAFPGFAAEPAITQALDGLAPGLVARVLAIDEARGWLLLEHVSGTPVASHLDRTDDAIRALVQLQRSAAMHILDLIATGVADRTNDRLVDDLAEALADAAGLGIRRSVDDQRILSSVLAAVTEVESLEVPTTLVHGDFHPANVMVDGDRIVIFDWSDAAWSNPLVDVGAWAAWYRDDPATVDRLWRTWTEAWGLAAGELDRARPALDVVVAAYHVVSYVRIAGGLEPLRVSEAVGAVQRFSDDLESAVSRR
jgi:hypothetical protein